MPEELGAKFIYSDNAMPTVDTNEPLIKEPGDLDRIGPLDPSKGRIPMAVEVARLNCEKASGSHRRGPGGDRGRATGVPTVRRMAQGPA